MIAPDKKSITVETTVNLPLNKVWNVWTNPLHIIHWNYAIDTWECPYAENDIRTGGNFLWRMEAKDGSMGFDFAGTYTLVEKEKRLEVQLGDHRTIKITFEAMGNKTRLVETFVPETMNPLEMQESGWQSILNNFKQYAEKTNKIEMMHFESEINATPEKVYSIMFEPSSYKKWTEPFNPTSSFRGSWDKGSKIHFIGVDGEGNQGGMVSRIKENRPHKFVSIEHLGELKGDKEIFTGEFVEQWAGILENYTFEDKKNKTLLKVDIDTNEEFKQFFIDTWPKALQKIKEISEN